MNYADNVREATTVTDTTTVSLAGAAQNYRSFASAYALNTTRIPVKVGPDSAGAWEVGAYTLSASGTLTRTTIISSSSAGAAVAFAAGAKDVTVVYPAAYAVDAENAVTLSSKRIQARIATLNTPGATPTFNTDNIDRLVLTSVGANITSMTTNMTGTPVEGDGLTIDITDAGTSRTIAWGTKFEDSTIALPGATTAGKKMTVYLDWNPIASKWRCVGYV
jgi:hypothetical protein